MYKNFKNQIIGNKNDEQKLKAMKKYLLFNCSYLSDNSINNLLDLINDFLAIHNRNTKRQLKLINDKKHYVTTSDAIDNTYLFDLLSNIDFNINNDYIIGLKNLLYDNNYNTNKIGLKIIIARYLNDLKDLNTLKVFKPSNDNLNDKFKFLVFKNDKSKNYTKLYYNNEYHLIIMNTLTHDSIYSVILYDNNKINDISSIIETKNNNIDKSIKHIDLSNDKYTDILEDKIEYLQNMINKVSLNDSEYIQKSLNDLIIEDNTYLNLKTSYEDYSLYEDNNDKFNKSSLSLCYEYIKNKYEDNNNLYLKNKHRKTLKNYHMNIDSYIYDKLLNKKYQIDIKQKETVFIDNNDETLKNQTNNDIKKILR